MYAWLPEDVHELNGRREGLLLLIVAVFVFVNAVALSLAVDGQLLWQHIWGPIVWLPGHCRRPRTALSIPAAA